MNDGKLFDPLPKGSIAEILVERITEALISGELKPGDKIPTEVEFSEKLGVSRNAVREAIKVLVAFGILEIRRPEGTFVVESFQQKLFDPMIYGILAAQGNQDDFLEFRLTCTMSAMYLAMKHASDEDIDHLQELGLRFREAMHDDSMDLDAKYKASMDFNYFLGEMSGNPMMMQLDNLIYRISKYSRRASIESSIQQGMPDALPDNYLTLVEIVRSRDFNAIPGFLEGRRQTCKGFIID
ncbi:MAG: FadR/GntR family transcriptional regulator [Anaerovoracaceae bacterium]